MRQISRDPFARETVYRETVRLEPAFNFKRTEGVNPVSCAWCGQRKRSDRLYRYYVERDGIYTRREAIADGRLFCCVDCMRAYTS